MNLKEIKRHKDIYILMFIPIIYFIIFKYVPMLNGQIAFKDFKPRLGVWGSPWAGFLKNSSVRIISGS